MQSASSRSENSSLLLYRLLSESESKKESFGDFVRHANSVLQRNKNLHQEVLDRQQATWTALTATHSSIEEGKPSLRAETSWRLAIGLSYGRLWNAGFQLHPLYGFPYIPARSWKGAFRHSAVEMIGDERDPFIQRAFGTASKEGVVQFFDAPAELHNPLLAEDVINQHNREYYRGADVAPADDSDPIPINFLTVAPGTGFRFAAFWPKGSLDAAEATCIREWFRRTLTEYGIGAKTRKGYGLFNAGGD